MRNERRVARCARARRRPQSRAHVSRHATNAQVIAARATHGANVSCVCLAIHGRCDPLLLRAGSPPQADEVRRTQRYYRCVPPCRDSFDCCDHDADRPGHRASRVARYGELAFCAGRRRRVRATARRGAVPRCDMLIELECAGFGELPIAPSRAARAVVSVLRREGVQCRGSRSRNAAT